MIKLFLFILLPLFLYSNTFTIASYNVENLFDLKNDRSDYKEYKPGSLTKWNNKNFNIKLDNVLKVINDIDADIIALQEIENKEIMKLLLEKLPNYKYYSFSKYNNSSIGLGFLSKIEIIGNTNIDVKFKHKIYRPILESTFKLDNIKFKIFNNHWPSKRVAESYRLKFAKKLFDRIKEIPRDYDYILLGDFNSNYDEFKTIYSSKKFNDTNGITGINQVLNTTIGKKFVTYDDILNKGTRVNYNLWLDLPYEKRFSNKYRGRNHTPDNIILSSALFDNKNISYIPKSFKVFKPNYLFNNNKILRWEMKNKIHQGSGYSDHLPILARFSTNSFDKNPLKKLEKIEINKISDLYLKTKLVEDVYLKDVIVIFKNKNDGIIKQKNDRAIYLYKNAKDLKEGFSYDLSILQIKDYNGLKEIESFEILKNNGKVTDYKNLYLEEKDIDLFDLKYQNEIIKNLNGKFIKGKLEFDNKKIRLYIKNKDNYPKENSIITVKRGHLGFYRDNVQIIIHNKSDIDVN